MKKFIIFFLSVLVLSFSANTQEIAWGKIIPKNYKLNIAETINLDATRLWDGRIGESWFEPIWFIPWEIENCAGKEKIEEVFGSNLGYPNDSVRIECELDGVYEIDTVKAYIQNAWRCIKIEANVEGDWQSLAVLGPYGQTNNEWQRTTVKSIKTDRLRVTFPEGWECARYINELELWGTKLSETPSNPLVLNLSGIFDYERNVTWYYVDNINWQEDIKVKYKTPFYDVPSCNMNGYKLEVIDCNLNDMTVTYRIDQRMIRSGRQFICINDVNEKEVFFERRKMSSSLDDPRNHSIERVYVVKDNEIIDIVNYDGENYENINIGYQDQGTSYIWYGSPLQDPKPYAKLYRNFESENGWDGVFLGYNSDYQKLTRISGYDVSRGDSLFWQRQEAIDFYEIKGKINLNVSKDECEDNFIYNIKGGRIQKGGELDFNENLEYTEKEQTLISGKVYDRNTKVFINGKEVTKDWRNRFEIELPLTKGYQAVSIEAVNDKKTVGYWTKEFYRLENSGINLTVDSDRITKEKNILIKGHVGNASPFELSINGKGLEHINGYFSELVELEEGKNNIHVIAVDENGRTAEQIIEIQKDSISPSINILYPENNSFFNTSEIQITGYVNEDGCKYSFDGITYHTISEKVFSETFKKEDGFYETVIYVSDIANNIGRATVNFCIDTHAPECLKLSCDVQNSPENMLNKDNVCILIEAEDSCSGISKYEYRLEEDKDWTECGSKIQLTDLKGQTYVVHVKVTDVAGNESVSYISIYVDSLEDNETVNSEPPKKLLKAAAVIPLEVGTEVEDLTFQEKLAAGSKYRTTDNIVDNLTVSMETGSLTNECVDFIIYGKNGFAYPIKRIYSTKQARQDSPSLINLLYKLNLKESVDVARFLNFLGIINGNNLSRYFYSRRKGSNLTNDSIYLDLRKIYQESGDYAINCGNGWKLNFPYVYKDINGLNIVLSDGSIYPFTEMKYLNRTAGLVSNHYRDNYANHNYEDFTFSIEKEYIPNTRGEFRDSAYFLTMKDGTSYSFNKKGQLLEISDSPKTNVIVISYNDDNLMSSIKDPYGNTINVKYENFSDRIKSSIKQFTFSTGHEVTYTYDTNSDTIANSNTNDKYYKYIKRNNFKNPPRLITVADKNKRETSYRYLTYYETPETILPMRAYCQDRFEREYIDSIFKSLYFSDYSDFINSECIKNFENVFGLEFPELLINVTTPDGLIQNINYEKKNISIEIEDKRPSSADSKDFTYVKSIETVNQTKINNKEYSFNMKLYKNNQFIVESSSIKETYDSNSAVYLETRNTYEKKDDNGNLYSQLIKRQVLLNSDTNIIESNDYEWNDANRIIKLTATKGKNKRITSNTYDNWGNIYREIITTIDCLGNTTTKTTESDIRHTNSITLKDSVFSDRPTTPAVDNKGIMNLVTKQKINIDGQLIYKSFAYDSYGRMVTQGIYDNGKWHDTKTEYFGSNSGISSGFVSKVTTPLNQVYSYAYMLSSNVLYITKTALQVKLSDVSSTLTDVSTKTGFDVTKGKTVYEKDGNGTETTYAFDSIGRMTKKDTTSAGGYVQAIVYDDIRRVITLNKIDTVTVNGNLTDQARPYKRYYYDCSGNITKIEQYDYKKSSNPQIVEEEALYDGMGNLISYTDQNGKKTSFTYDGLGRMTWQTHPNGFRERIDYDDSLNTVRKYNESYIEGIIEYVNFDGKPVKIKRLNWLLEGDLIKEVKYDAENRIVEEKDINNYKSTYTYDSLSNVKTILKDEIEMKNSGYSDTQNPYNEYIYDGCGQVISNRNGVNFLYGRFLRTEDFTYNGVGNQLSVKKGSWYNGQYGSDSRKISYSYDKNGNKTSEVSYSTMEDANINVNGLAKNYTYNKLNLLASQSDETGVVTTYSYDRDGNNTKIIVDGKYTSTFSYDDFGRLTKAVYPEIPGQSVKNEIAYEYDNHGNLTKQTENNGRITKWRYDSENRKIFESVGTKSSTIITKGWTYYPYGMVEAEYTGCSIDANGTLSGGIKTKYIYDNYGRLSIKSYADGRTETYTYDKKDNVIAVKYADSSSKNYEYNKLGYCTKETDEEGKIIEHFYDIWGEESYRIEYRTDGDIQWKIDYNIYGEVSKEKQYPSREWTYQYDGRGLLINRTDPKGIITSFAYDKCGRPVIQNSSCSGTVNTKTYKYDRYGNITEASDGNVTTRIENDNAYALPVSYTTTVGSSVFKTSYGYDKGQRLSFIEYPDGKGVNFTYNEAGLLLSVGSGKKSEGKFTTYASGGTYDASGHLKSLTAGNSSKRTESWDTVGGTLNSYSWSIPGNSGNSIVWNNRGNITQLTKNGTQKDFLYDHKNQLTSETKGSTTNTWEYDEKGNRTKTNDKNSTCYQYSDLIKKDGTWYYNYDKNGNLVSKGKSASVKTSGGLYEGWTFSTASGETWKYEYDNFNRLVKVWKSTAGTNNLKEVESNTYDYRDLLVSRKNGSTEEFMEYSPEGTLLYDKKGSLVRDYIYANGMVWCELQGTSVYYHHTDYLGTTEYITDTNKNVVWNCEYEAFGSVITKTNSSFIPSYTGKKLDETTGLYYFNARWYDSKSGRFITEDPARDGINWYRYCENNPLICTDPNGLVPVAYGNPDGLYPKIQEVDTGNKVLDYAGASLFACYNFMATAANTITNGIAATSELIDRGITALDSYWDPSFTFTGQGIRQDIYAFEMLTVANPALFADIGKTVSESISYLKVMNTTDVINDAVKISENSKTIVSWPKKPHTNKTPGHWETIQKEVNRMENSGEYEKIYVNKGIRNEFPNASKNSRPDIMGVRTNGLVDQVEVPSKTDDVGVLWNRLQSNREMMGNRAGTINVLRIEMEN